MHDRSHVILGTGPAGRTLADRLLDHGHDVRMVSRTPKGDLPRRVEHLVGDLADPGFATDAFKDADVGYFCINAPDYHRWAEQFPPIQAGLLRGARAAGIRLVVLENLYAYGPPEGRPLREDLPMAATDTKGRVRAEMTRSLLEGHARGDFSVAIGRASDFVGPRVTDAAFGAAFLPNLVAGRRGSLIGDLDQPHSYHDIRDVAAGLATLGLDPVGDGQIWHLPIDRARTTREWVDGFAAEIGRPAKVMSAGRSMLRVAGLFDRKLRSLTDTLYQFTEPWVVDDGRFRATFGDRARATPMATTIADTVAWYRQASVPR